MSISDYKNSIKELIDSTDNESLLKNWKSQLEWDLEHLKATGFSPEEWNLVQEGIADYENGDILSLQEFLTKR
jgi:hypothetical protein